MPCDPQRSLVGGAVSRNGSGIPTFFSFTNADLVHDKLNGVHTNGECIIIINIIIIQNHHHQHQHLTCVKCNVNIIFVASKKSIKTTFKSKQVLIALSFGNTGGDFGVTEDNNKKKKHQLYHLKSFSLTTSWKFHHLHSPKMWRLQARWRSTWRFCDDFMRAAFKVLRCMRYVWRALEWMELLLATYFGDV